MPSTSSSVTSNEDGGRLALLDPDELADDDVVAVVSTMGAPLVRPALMR